MISCCLFSCVRDISSLDSFLFVVISKSILLICLEPLPVLTMVWHAFCRLVAYASDFQGFKDIVEL